MFRIAAIVAFALAVIFYLAKIGHDVLTWTLFALLGLLFLALDGVTWSRP